MATTTDGNNPNSLKCSQCVKESAEFQCLDCEIELCKKCSKYHMKIPAFKTHTVKELASPPLVCLMCDGEEGCEIKVFCKDCNGYLCSECTNCHTNLNPCKSHVLQPLVAANLPQCKTHEIQMIGELSVKKELDETKPADTVPAVVFQPDQPKEENQTNNLSVNCGSDHAQSREISAYNFEGTDNNEKELYSIENNYDVKPQPDDVLLLSGAVSPSPGAHNNDQSKEESHQFNGIGQIKEFKIKASTFCSIILCWKEINNVDGYQIMRNVEDRTMVYESKENQITIPQLEPSQRYSFQICGIKGNTYGPGTHLEADTKVKRFKAKCTHSSITLTWDKVADIDQYKIVLGEGQAIYMVNADVCNKAIDGLSPGEDYSFEICAVKGDTDGQITSVDATTKDVPKVTGFKVVHSLLSSISLSWDELPDVDGYQLKSPGREDVNFDINTQHIVRDLIPKQRYRFTICAVVKTEKGPEEYLETETSAIPEVEDVMAIEQSLVSVTLTWSEAYEKSDSLEIKFDELTKNTPIKDQSIGLEILSPDNSHNLRISSIKGSNKVNCFQWKINPTDLPDRGLGDPVSKIDINWRHIHGVDKYEVTEPGKPPCYVTENRHTVFNSLPGKDFTVHIAAMKGDEKGNAVKIISRASCMDNYRRYRFHEFLRIYGLFNHLENPITLQDLLLVDQDVVQERIPEKPSDLPLLIFHKIMMLNYKARSAQVETKTVKSLQGNFNQDSHKNVLGYIKASSQNKNVTTQVHPLDLLLAMFYCSDMFAQQYFVTKLSQCQLALPFLIHNPSDFKFVFPLWTFRSLKKGWCTKNSSASESSEIYENQHMVNAKSKIISFMRFGGSQLSKSELMNSILSRSHEIFLHRNSKGSRENRILVDGTAEMSWYLPSGKKNDVFSELVTFVNLRGDAKLCETQCNFLCSISTAVVILLPSGADIESVPKQVERINSNIDVMYIITDSEAQMTTVERSWYFGIKNKNKSEITEVIQQSLQAIVTQSENSKALSLADCASKGKKCFQIYCDEDNEKCIYAKKIVDSLMKEITTNTNFEMVKTTLLPLQGEEWYQWSETKKKIYRPKLEVNETIAKYDEKLKNKLKDLRTKQAKRGLPPNQVMKDVIDCLTDEPKDIIMFFMQWIKFELDFLSEKKLVKLNSEFNTLWDETEKCKKELQNDIKDNKIQKEEKTWNEEKIKQMAIKLQTKNEKIVATSIGTKHILREISQMYECAKENAQHWPKLIKMLPAVAAQLLLDGQAIELMDGDAGHVPCEWISSVLSLVAQKSEVRKKEARIFVLTVLGIQSSGKSTLLNAMFGLQFTVSAGRCTRGAYMQLLTVADDMQDKLNYEYILVIDTEGLRSSEMYTATTQTRDNELATFVIGLGDVTLINIFGENPSDINDILQIVVQAFLRMKKINFNPRCYFVHQNVGAVDAKDKLKAGRRNMMDKLNDMTKIAAEQEGSCEQYFSEVIAFDQEENFCYLSTLWEGDPPMAPPNPGYSEKIHSLKCVLLNLPANENVQCLKVRDLNGRIQDIWQGLLCENFVFNFKNTLEISVYRQVESKFNKWRWEMYKCVEEEQDEALNIIDNARGNKHIFEKVKMNIQGTVRNTYDKLKQEADDYFENSDQRHISIQWKGKIEIELENTRKYLVKRAHGYCEEFLNSQVTMRKIELSIADAENIFFEKAKELAKGISQHCTKQEHENAFNYAWGKWMAEISLTTSTIEEIDVWQEAEHCIRDSFSDQDNFILDKLKQTPLKSIEKFELNNKDHIHSTKTKQKFKQLIWKSTNEEVTQTAKAILDNANKRLDNIKAMGVSKYKPGSERYFTKEIMFIKESVKQFQQGKQNLYLKENFTVDLALIVVSRTAHLLKNLHQQYLVKHDPKLIIEDKKSDIYETFLKYVQGTNAGIVGADIWIGKLQTAVWKAFTNKTTGIVKDHAVCNLPAFNGNKSKLDIHVKRHLVETESFDDYMKYILTPKSFVDTFAYRCIKSKSIGPNQSFNSNIEEACHGQIEKLYQKCIDAHHKTETQAKFYAFNYILNFQEHVNQYLSLGAAVDSFREQASDITERYLGFFLEQLELRLPQIKLYCNDQLQAMLGNPEEVNSIIVSASTEVSNFFTSDSCWEICPFCKEMCTSTIQNHTQDHSVLFHKPQGIGGWFYKGTKQLVLEHCTSLVKSDRKFYPDPEDDERKIEYKKYKAAGPPYNKWSITADDSMKKHWQWFSVRFNNDLHKYYDKKMVDIPSSWKKITKLEVLDELMTPHD